ETERTYLDATCFLTHWNVATALTDMLAWVKQQKADRVSLKKYLYDAMGQIHCAYEYGKVNAQGEGENHDPLTKVVYTYHDIYGNLTSQQKLQNQLNKILSVTQQSFDKLQRLVKQVTPLGEVT